LRDHVEGEALLVGAAFAKAFDLAIDDAGVDLLQHVIAEAEALDRAGSQVLGEHIRGLDQLFDQFDAFRVLQVDRCRALVRVEDLEIVGIGAARAAAGNLTPGSPRPGFSILTTSAPSQAKASVQVGPASNWVRSTTLTPLRQLSGANFHSSSASPHTAGPAGTAFREGYRRHPSTEIADFHEQACIARADRANGTPFGPKPSCYALNRPR